MCRESPTELNEWFHGSFSARPSPSCGSRRRVAAGIRTLDSEELAGRRQSQQVSHETSIPGGDETNVIRACTAVTDMENTMRDCKKALVLPESLCYMLYMHTETDETVSADSSPPPVSPPPPEMATASPQPLRAGPGRKRYSHRPNGAYRLLVMLLYGEYRFMDRMPRGVILLQSIWSLSRLLGTQPHNIRNWLAFLEDHGYLQSLEWNSRRSACKFRVREPSRVIY